jgi:hypothetical protein
VNISIGSGAGLLLAPTLTSSSFRQRGICASAYTQVVLDGAQAKSIFWQVAGQVEIMWAQVHLEGVLLSQDSRCILDRRLSKRTHLGAGGVHLQMAGITDPLMML